MKFKYFFLLYIFFSFISIRLKSQQFKDSTNIINPIDSTLKKNILDKTLALTEFKFGRVTINTFPLMNLDPSSGLAGGIMPIISIAPKAKSKFYRPSSLVSYCSYSTQKWLNIKSDLVLFTQKGLTINAYVQYIGAPDKYYGIANDTINTNPVLFNIRDLEIKGDIAKSIFTNTYVGLVFDISHTYTESLGITSEGLDVPAQKNQLLTGVGPYLAFDNRNNINYPSKGEFITAGFLFYAPHAENAYSFYTFSFDAKDYTTIYKDFILATQLFTGYSNGDIPFYNLFQLGGKSRMRGISNKYMYIDSHIYYTQAELRKHIWGRFGMVAFAGIGNTFSSYSNLDFPNTKYVYGCGIRFQTNKRDNLNLRLDYGRGKFGDSGIYMTMREAF